MTVELTALACGLEFASPVVMQVGDELTTTILALMFEFLLFRIHFPVIEPLLFLLNLLVTSYFVAALKYIAASLYFFEPNVNIVMNILFVFLKLQIT